MSSELELLRQRITELEVMNSELEAKYIEVIAENIEVKAENVKLSRALEENEARFTNLEQRDKEKATLIAKLDDDVEKIKQSSVSTSSIENSDNTVAKRQLEKKPKPSNTSGNASNSDVCQSVEDKETDDFLDKTFKKSVSDGFRQRNRERQAERKKLLRESATQDLSGDVQKGPSSSVTQDKESRSHKKKEAENIVQDVFDFTMTEISLTGREGNNCQEKIESQGLAELSSSDVLQNINRLYGNACTDDPEEKRKYIIGLVLEKFSYLSLDDSDERRDTFNLDSSALCPLCNGDHKVNRSIFDEIKGEWGTGEYYGELTYRLNCRESLKHGIPIVSVKA